MSIENFIIENFDDVTISLDQLVRLTLAYHLADETKKELLIKLFIEIKSNIEVKIQEDYKVLKGRIYGDLEDNNAFLWNGNLLRAEQIRKVENTTLPKLRPQIDKILSVL